MQVRRQWCDRFGRRPQRQAEDAAGKKHTAMDRRTLGRAGKGRHQVWVRQHAGPLARLERYGAVALRDARGSTVTSISGTLWLTMEGDSRDIVLDPGASFVVERDGLTIVAAHQASVVDVAGPQQTRGWLERCADFIDSTWGPRAIRPSRNWVY